MSSDEHHSFYPPVRYAGPKESQLTEQQRRIKEDIELTRTTGLNGPFSCWLASATIGDRAQQLGKACRYDTVFSQREAELIILITAAYSDCTAEWDIHLGEAKKAGLEELILSAINKWRGSWGEGEEGEECKDIVAACNNEKERLIARLSVALLEGKGKVENNLYNECVRSFENKERAIMDCISITGYYTYVAFTLNCFQVRPLT